MDFNLNETIKNIRINGLEFVCDTADLASIRALIAFDDQYNAIRDFNDAFLSDCKTTIDTVLGIGTYNRLFKKPSLKPYYLIQKLKEIFYADAEGYISDNTKKELGEIKDVVDVINNMTGAMNKMNEYAEKYDIR